MHGAETTANLSQKTHLTHDDTHMEAYLMRGDDNKIYILHDTPFATKLSWVEYNPQNGHIAFVMEDGNIRDFGIPVNKEFMPLIAEQEQIAVALVSKGEFLSGHNYPLIKYKK